MPEPRTPYSARIAHNVVDLRLRPARDSERVSQLLLGASVTALDTDEGWVRIEGPDSYRGWVESRWLRAAALPVNAAVVAPFAEVRAGTDPSSRLIVRLPGHAAVFAGDEAGPWRPVTLADGATGYTTAETLGPLACAPCGHAPATAAALASEFVGTPYLWGGSSPFGFDCSGLVQFAYARAGLTLRRDADIQRSDVRFTAVPFEALEPGDLVFFGTAERITHVGMHYEPGWFVHSAGGAGVILSQWGDERYSPGFVDARRLDPDRADWPVARFEAENR